MYQNSSDYKYPHDYKGLYQPIEQHACTYNTQVCNYSKSRGTTKGSEFVLPVLVVLFFAISLLPVAFQGKDVQSSGIKAGIESDVETGRGSVNCIKLNDAEKF